MAIDIARLRDFENLDRLSPETLRKTARCAVEIEVHDGDALFGEGDPPDAVYLLDKGAFLLTRASRSEPVSLRRAPAWLGEMAAVDGGHHMLTAVAHEDSKLIEIPLEDFTSLLHEDPALARILLDQAIRVMRSSLEQG